jgi:hypothetical protein
MQLWLMSHGLVAAVLAGMISPADLQRFLPEMAHSMFVALGDSPQAASRSIDRALHRMEQVPPQAALETEGRGPHAVAKIV